MEKKLTFEDLKKADEVLDTLVFGKSLGLFGQKLFNGNAESLEKDLKNYLVNKGIIDDDKISIVGHKVYFNRDVRVTNLTTKEFDVCIKKGVTMVADSDPYTTWKGIKMFKVKSPDTGCVYEVNYDNVNLSYV